MGHGGVTLDRVHACLKEIQQMLPRLRALRVFFRESLIHVSEAAKPKAKIREKAHFYE